VLAEYQIETILRLLPQLTSLRVDNRLIER
jgi:hypothetical protein